MKHIKSLLIMTFFALIIATDLVVANYIFDWKIETLSDRITEKVSSGISQIADGNILSAVNAYFSNTNIVSPEVEASTGIVSDDLDSGYDGSKYQFKKNYYPYYGLLSEEEQEVYAQIYANATYKQDKFRPVAKITVDQLNQIWMCVCYDHPELFWLESTLKCAYNDAGYCTEIDLVFNDLINNFDEAYVLFHSTAQAIMNGAEKFDTDYEKEVYVHDTLADMITYKDDAKYNQSAYSALVGKETVCAGYAKAFQYILTKLEIPCYYVVGDSNGAHAWNIVKLSGEYYNVDLTWDDAVSSYRYFNRTDKDFAKTHTRDALSQNLPECNGETYRNKEEIKTAETPDLNNGKEGGIEEEQPVIVTEQPVVTPRPTSTPIPTPVPTEEPFYIPDEDLFEENPWEDVTEETEAEDTQGNTQEESDDVTEEDLQEHHHENHSPFDGPHNRNDF